MYSYKTSFPRKCFYNVSKKKHYVMCCLMIKIVHSILRN